jgi:hypothetical protein
MDIKEVRNYISDFQRIPLPPAIPRELTVSGRESLINTIIGPRRAGKTYLLYQHMKLLEPAGVLYLNFEDTRLASVNFMDFPGIVKIHTEVTGKEPRHIFVDEPQNVASWERGIRTLFDAGRYIITITGSSSKLLGSEIATQLRGRGISHLLLPYSFREFLTSRGVETPKVIGTTDEAVLMKTLSEWLGFGGYPEVAKAQGDAEKMKILDTYKDLIIYRDVIERHKVKSPFLVKLLIEHMIECFTKEFSINSFYNLIKSRNIRSSKKTLYSYVSFIEDSVSFFMLEKWDAKLKERRLALKKVYLCDTGLAYRQREYVSKLMENAVFLELRRKQNLDPEMELYYWKDHQQKEVDFIIRRGKRTEKMVQVTYSDQRQDLKGREIENLQAAAAQLGCSSAEIITWGYEGSETVPAAKPGGPEVRLVFVPLWKWLLGRQTPAT